MLSLPRWFRASQFYAAFALFSFKSAWAEPTPEPAKADDFGKDIQLAPFVVNGAPISVSIHARTKADRRYAEKFADEVVEIAYQTLGSSTGKGLIIVGAEKEPHPVTLFRKFIAMARAGKLDASLTEDAGKLEAMLVKLQERFKSDEKSHEAAGINFDAFMPALPMPLEGAGARLYQLAWAEGFDGQRIEQKLKSITHADLDRDEFTRFDWVFYVPPQSVISAVFKDVLKKAMTAEKMGIFKRAAVRSAVFVFNPVVKKAFDAMRRGLLFMTILRAEGNYPEGDVDALTKVYIRAIMPDLKPGSGDERARALAAIEKQKIANAEYAKDPFVKPTRLVTFDAVAYLPFEGEYGSNPEKLGLWFKREGDVFRWDRAGAKEKPRLFYPAGERLLVNETGTVTIQFLVNEKGDVTGVEERWVRERRTIPRKDLPGR
ncbi:hypothetical protein [Oleiharenicola lentus]|uniref:hypothetical protein n=1 Tax=Oleiharenicola lentus TaxID=2508720 RepID=UPI003F675153